jgi:predicted small metal-binding protein
MATRRRPHRHRESRMNDQEGDMRAIDCPCGHHFEAADDYELFRLCREHVTRDHPGMQRTDEEIRDRITADAYDGATVA